MVDAIRQTIELSAVALEALAVALILVAVVHGTARYVQHLRTDRSAAYQSYKVYLGKALILGLEFLVAADIVRTVALDPTVLSVSLLGLLIVVRTFLSWSLVIEIEGRWPWQPKRAE
jgi:uncharacterized membrane protein